MRKMTLLAPLHGTVSNYCYLPGNRVMIQKKDYRYTIINKDVFNDLYYELDEYRCALKIDCIEYIRYYYEKPLCDYPEWFISLIYEGWITSSCFDDEHESIPFLFLDENGETAMSDGSVILRNFMGHVRYIEIEDFEKYYEIIAV